MSIPITNSLEKKISENVDSIIGTDDINLNTVMKLAQLQSFGTKHSDEIDRIITSLTAGNAAEKYFYEQQMQMTLDSSGNIINAYDIEDDVCSSQSKTDLAFQLPEPEGSE